MKKLCLLVLLLNIECSIHAQVIEWQNTIGGSSVDGIYSIEQTSDGGYILGGCSLSNISGDKTENCYGNNDYWIVKTDASGVVLWDNTIGGSDVDVPFSTKQTTDGGYILGGNSRSNISGDKTENSNGLEDIWIVKTDNSGVIQWQNTIGGSNNDNLLSIQQTSDGGYILGGLSESNISGDKSENSNGLWDYWLIKIDASGTIQWENTIGGNDYDEVMSIQQTTDGGYILGGHSMSDISGDKTEDSNGGYDYWIVKTDSSGNIQWQNTIGGNSGDHLRSVQQTPDGGYILGGYSASTISGDKTEGNIGGEDYWIVKIDMSGAIQWQNTIGGSNVDRAFSIQQTNDGGFILHGFSNSNISGDKTENSNGDYDFWIVKADSTGLIQWQNTIGGSDDESLGNIRQNLDGKYYLCGTSASNISGDKTENCNGGGDYWIMTITDKYNSINGKLFIDANSNGVQDIGELPAQSKQVTEINTNRICFSEQDGMYKLFVLDSGNFSVTPTLNYYTAVPVSHNVNFTSILQVDSLNDFAFQPNGVFNDLCVSITPITPFRAGFNANYLITYENIGTTTLNPTIIFFPDADVNFVSSTPAASTITLDSAVWNFGPLSPFQSGSILVTVHVNTGILIGTLINSSAVVAPIIGDANTACNYSFWEAFTIGSMDPNDILVNEDTLFTTLFPNPPYLEYIIRFQNTGNDTAFTVKVLNPIDTNMLDLSTIEFVASSHPVNLSWIPWERNMEFRFENILLPDSTMNEPASHGFVRYRIKPKSTLTVGDSITNYAAIYFDFNSPVITNIAVTHIVLPTSIPEVSSFNKLLIYPNPASSVLTIEIGILPVSNSPLIISDVTGRTLVSKQITSASTIQHFDISTFSQGIYFIQLHAGEKISRGRFVKE